MPAKEDWIANGRKGRRARWVALPCHSERSEESLIPNGCEGGLDREGAKGAKNAKGCRSHTSANPQGWFVESYIAEERADIAELLRADLGVLAAHGAPEAMEGRTYRRELVISL